MKLIDPTNDQLDRAFAEHVCGWNAVCRCGESMKFHSRFDHTPVELEEPLPYFTRSADAVLPWLENTDDPDAALRDGLWSVAFYVDKENNWVRGEDKSLPRAACIALLRAHGVEVEFTK